MFFLWKTFATEFSDLQLHLKPKFFPVAREARDKLLIEVRLSEILTSLTVVHGVSTTIQICHQGPPCPHHTVP